MRRFAILPALTCALLLGPHLVAQQHPHPAGRAEVQWTGTWAAAPVPGPVRDLTPGTRGLTFRDVVHVSIGGRALRIRLTNEGNPHPLRIGAVHVAVSAGSGSTRPASDHAVLFAGSAEVTIPAGSVAWSDPVDTPVQPFADLAVSIFVPPQDPPESWTMHSLASSSNFAAAGDQSRSSTLDQPTKLNSWYLLKGVDVDAGPHAAAVVALGASITDGAHSTPDLNARWPDDLARRLAANRATASIGVLNEGISGGRILHDGTGPSALARLDRDVLAQPGAGWMILALGTNDIGRTFFPLHPNEQVTSADLEWGLRQVVQRAHARGIRVIAATLNPFEGADYYSPDGETMRQAFNTFVRSSGIFDGVADFDKALLDPTHPARMLPAYDSGDHLHPNEAGYRAVADSFDLKFFQQR